MAGQNSTTGTNSPKVPVDRVERLVKEALEDVAPAFRRRGPTMLKLQWLAERLRKAERIRKQLEEGTYSYDTKAVARAMLNLDVEEA